MAGKIIYKITAGAVILEKARLLKISWRPNTVGNIITVTDRDGNIIIKDKMSVSSTLAKTRDYHFRGNGFRVNGIIITSMTPLAKATFYFI